ncbi:MAG TPA: protease complex subunit PrcB family protein [Gemmatimonadaceae bacterium]|nr:protease complex subunit PrcB family protein [Gemmatimonadaceae bacterium]
MSASARLAAAMLIVAMPVAAQQPREAATTVREKPPAGLIRFRESGEGFAQFSGIPDSLRIVIRDAESWREYWTAIHRPFVPAPALPEVDFTREMVVLAAMGSRPSGGYAVRIDHAMADSARVILRIRSMIPGSGCAVPAVLTQPLDMARIPATTRVIGFVEHVERIDCSRALGTSSPPGDISGIMLAIDSLRPNR